MILYLQNINIYDKIKENLSGGYTDLFKKMLGVPNNKETCKSSTIEIECTLLEKYQNKYKKIMIGDNNIIVPLRELEIKYDGMGKLLNSNKDDLIIQIKVKNDSEFKIINDNDLEITKMISIYEYIFGGSLKINHIDNEEIKVEFDSNINRNPVYKIKNKGLPYTELKNEDDFVDCNILKSKVLRGDLYVKIYVKEFNKDDKKYEELIKVCKKI